MKKSTMKSSLLQLLFLLCLLSPVAAQSGVPVARSRRASVELKGLRSRVIVRRDARGIPYVEASNEDDLYFAQGYATASDRLWQMDLLRRTARGELAEIFGRAVLEEDRQHRLYGFAALSEAMAAQLSPRMRRALESYARGVNAFIAAHDDTSLPPEFVLLGYRPREWRVADSLAVGKNLAESLSTTWQTDLMRASLADLSPARRAALLPETSPLDVLVVGSDDTVRGRTRAATTATTTTIAPAPDTQTSALTQTSILSALAATVEATRRSLARVGLDAEARAASNNWVVSGKRTASGQPMLANDPHLSPSAPSIWYLTHLSAPGLRVAGVTIPGVPGIILGHNERIAWGATNLGSDVQDLYAEKFDKENPRRYLTPQGWREAQVRHEEIRVRKSQAGVETESVFFDVTVTQHGPVVLEQNGTRYALRWTALDAQSNEFVGFFLLDRAGNWKEFTDALSHYTGPAQNFVYADTGGHIGYYGAGRIPIRKSGDGQTPYDGSTGAGEWTRDIPFAQLPHVYDPPSGLIVTANQRVVGHDYPSYLTNDWAQPYRARRILELLQAKPKLTVEDFRAIQSDTYSYGGSTFARAVVEATKGQAVHASDDNLARHWRDALAEFDKWDGRMVADSRVAAVVSPMRAAFRRRILTSAIGAERAAIFDWNNFDTALDRIVRERPAEWLPKEFNDYNDFLLACYADARQALMKRLGANETQWTWGNWAQVRFPHPLAAVPGIGRQFSVQPFAQNGSGSASGAGPTVNVGAGVSMRLIADLSDWDKTRQGIAPGEAGDPNSQHWQDQLSDWRAVSPHVFPFSQNAVRGAAAGEMLLLPPRVK